MSEDLELMKNGYKLRKSDSIDDFEKIQLENSMNSVLSRMSKDDRKRYFEWREFQIRIEKNDFPELTQ